MNPIIRNILAVLAGIVVGSAVNMSIVMMSSSVIPPPEGADLTTAEGLKASMHLMQPKHFIMPFLAHALGTIVGAWLASRIAASQKMKFALGIGFFFMLGGLANVLMLPSPLWFIVFDLGLAYIPMAWLGGRLQKETKQNDLIINTPQMLKISAIVSIIALVLLVFDLNSQLNENKNEITNEKAISENSQNVNIWEIVYEVNFQFNKPSILKKNFSTSNQNQSVFSSQDNSIGMTITFDFIPSDFIGKNIQEVILNPKEFANSIHQENKSNFSDYSLVNYSFTPLGNKQTFLVTQTSKQMTTNKNQLQTIESYFVISENRYINIVFAYNPEEESIINKIKTSFSFP